MESVPTEGMDDLSQNRPDADTGSIWTRESSIANLQFPPLSTTCSIREMAFTINSPFCNCNCPKRFQEFMMVQIPRVPVDRTAKATRISIKVNPFWDKEHFFRVNLHYQKQSGLRQRRLATQPSMNRTFYFLLRQK